MKVTTALFCSAEAALLFVIFASPLAYRLSDATLGRFLIPTTESSKQRLHAPTVFGVVVHALLFMAVVYGLLRASLKA